MSGVGLHLQPSFGGSKLNAQWHSISELSKRRESTEKTEKTERQRDGGTERRRDREMETSRCEITQEQNEE
jgi:hypothetical protein